MNSRSARQIAIIGSGPAGCGCAIGLLKSGAGEPVLIDLARPPKFHIGESIPPETNNILKQLGLYGSFCDSGHEASYGSCSYWGSDKRGYNDTLLSPFGHGWHLNRERFNRFLLDHALQRGAKIQRKCEFRDSEQTSSGHRLVLRTDDNERVCLNADFVIDASGTRSVFATRNGSRKVAGLSLICLGLRFALAEHPSTLTHVEAAEHGWWYAARIPGEQLLVTFYTTAETVKSLALQNMSNWLKLLNDAPQTTKLAAHRERLDRKLLGFSAPSFHLDRPVGKAWMAIGDAATTYDPITAHGIFKSLSQGMQAARTIDGFFSGASDALDLFAEGVLSQYRRYEQVRSHFYCLEQRWPNSPFWQSVHNISANE